MSDWSGIRDVQDDPESLERFNGEWRGRYTWVVDDETIAECRTGYRCINCMERFRGSDGMPEAWPIKCPVCMYPVRERQAEDMGPEDRGEIRVGPGTTIEDELEIMEEKRHERLWTPKGSILVPKSIE